MRVCSECGVVYAGGMALRRVQVLLDEKSQEWLDEEARCRGISRSQMVRELVRAQVRDDEANRIQPLLEFLEWFDQQPVAEGPTDLSVHHDTYLYGAEMRL